MRNGKVTIVDIAAKTGYATNTVSLALRGSTRISQPVRELISKAARDLDYVPNNMAKSLVSRRSNTVGLILHDINNPILTSVAKVVQEAFQTRGYSVLFASSDGDPAAEDRAIQAFRSRMIDGLLIYPIDHVKLDHLRQLRSHNFPVILLIGTKDVGIDSVGIDETKGGYDAVQHLIHQGHTRIGAIVEANAEKLVGYKQALENAAIPFDPDIVREPSTHSIAASAHVMREIMTSKNPPTAIFAASDKYSLGALRWATVAGLRVPADVAIVGFDDTEYAAQAALPITSIHHNVERLAKEAVERMVLLIEAKGELPPPTSSMFPGELVVRESSASIRADHQ